MRYYYTVARCVINHDDAELAFDDHGRMYARRIKPADYVLGWCVVTPHGGRQSDHATQKEAETEAAKLNEELYR